MFGKKKEESKELENLVIFEGTLTRGVTETKATQGLYTVKVKGLVNDTACEIPVFIKSELIAELAKEIPAYSAVKVKGHLEYPISRNMTTRLICVADRIENL